MRTSCSRALGAAIVLAACALPLGAQQVFKISAVRDTDVVVVSTASDAKARQAAADALKPFDLFDVYASQDADGRYVDFADSLYFDKVTPDGVVMRYVWEGERKFLQKDFFVVATGRTYQVEQGEPQPSAMAPAGAGTATQLPGSFGVPGLEINIAPGIGVMGQDLTKLSSITSPSIAWNTTGLIRVRYGIVDLSVHGSIPIPSFSLKTASIAACLDLCVNYQPYFAMYMGVGVSNETFVPPKNEAAGVALDLGIYLDLPVFGPTASTMLYFDYGVCAPGISLNMQRMYTTFLVGLKL